jgi:undecaprenyl diphosphate synthase
MVMSEQKGIPEHIAIVMDGNGRWANARGLPRMVGHRQGSENMRRIIQECLNLGVQYLTLYAFSTENWKRPQAEVDYLMSLPGMFYDRERHLLHENQVRVVVIGDPAPIPTKTREVLQRMQAETVDYRRLTLLMAFNYGGRAELVRAAGALAKKAAAGLLPRVTEADLAAELYTAGIPDPDILIRCGNEMRLSNFLLWQVAYAELFFSEKLWPEFSPADLRTIVAAYNRRERRFGGIMGLAEEKKNVPPGAGHEDGVQAKHSY